MKKKVFFIIIIIAIILVGIFLFNKPPKERLLTQDIKVVPLSSEERQQVTVAVISNEFIKDIPEKNPITLTFYSFEGGERTFHDSFLIGKQGFLTEGEPTAYIYLHSKYISDLNEDNLCETIREANKNGDLGFYSEHNKVSLLIKYASMLKHRECLGF